MRTSVRRVTLTGAVALAAFGATAAAATPPGGTAYHGTGGDYFNNAPKWTREGAAQPVSFHTSASGARLLGFRGRYSYYCGAGTSYVTARYINVSRRGRFAYRFSVVQRAAGRVIGRAYVAIWGAFASGGRRASVSYLVDFVGTGEHVVNPYSIADATALGCASWVRATVHRG